MFSIDKKYLHWSCLVGFSLLLSIGNSVAGDLYSFAVDMDGVSGTAANTLNQIETPDGLTAADQIHIKDGHFYTVGPDLLANTIDDRRVRFWGTNLSMDMVAYSDHPGYDVNDLASRFENMGFNIVRLHGLDSNLYTSNNNHANGNPIGEFNTLLDYRAGSSFPMLHSENLADLDRVINIFKSHGIYVDLGLRVNHRFDRYEPNCYSNSVNTNWPDQCLPDPMAVTAKYSNGVAEMEANNRPVDHFHPGMMELQKWFIENLMNHTNIESGLVYKNDPGIAMVEITNESSLLDYYRYDEANFQKSVPPKYAELFDQMWHDWLLIKYSEPQNNNQGLLTPNEALDAAWQPVSSPNGHEVVRNGGFQSSMTLSYPDWIVHSTKTGNKCPLPVNGTHWATGQVVINGGDHETEISLVEKPCSNAQYYLQFKQLLLGINPANANDPVMVGIEADTAYRVSFTARTESTTITSHLDIGISYTDANNATKTILNANPVQLVPNAGDQAFSFYFYSYEAAANAQLTFTPFIASDADGDIMETEGAKVYIDDISIRYATPEGLTSGEGFGQNDTMIARPHRDFSMRPPPVPAWEQDYLEFFYSTERDYIIAMRDYLRVDLGIKQVITGSQADYGGLLAQKIIADELDFVDAHFYWDNNKKVIHPDNTWFYWINNSPMVADPGGSVVDLITSTRIADKPYTITEYGMPNLNEYTQESPLMVASYAALQDIDAIFFFNYHTKGGGYDPRFEFTLDAGQDPWIPTRHNALREARKETQMNMSANIFRRGDVAAATSWLKLLINDDMAYEQMGLNSLYGARSINRWLGNAEYFTGLNSTVFDSRIGLTTGVEIVHAGDVPVTQSAFLTPSSPHITGSNEIIMNESAEASWLAVNTQRTQAIAGYINNVSSTNTGVPITGVDGSGQFGSVSITSSDSAPIKTSSNLLVTSIGKVKNAEIIFQNRPDGLPGFVPCTSAQTPPECSTNLWQPTTGPVMTESNGAMIELKGAARTISVEKLNAAGDPNGLIPVTPIAGGYSFIVGVSGDDTPWYRVTSSLPVPTLIEAESAQAITPTGNTVQTDATASGSQYVAFEINGDVTIAIPGNLLPGDYYVELALRGKEYDGVAQITVHAGNPETLIGTVSVPDVLGVSWQRVLVSDMTVALDGSAAQTIRLVFTNDLVGPDGLDRSVHIDTIRLYRANLQPHMDADNDGILNSVDNCEGISNAAQLNIDGDGQGDVCDDDIDGDGLINTDEAMHGTEPLNPDTDGDGYHDGTEVSLGSDPLDINSIPIIVADGDINLDGQINAADILLAQRHVLGLASLLTEQIAHGDFRPSPDGDDQLGLADLLLIIKTTLSTE